MNKHLELAGGPGFEAILATSPFRWDLRLDPAGPGPEKRWAAASYQARMRRDIVCLRKPRLLEQATLNLLRPRQIERLYPKPATAIELQAATVEPRHDVIERRPVEAAILLLRITILFGHLRAELRQRPPDEQTTVERNPETSESSSRGPRSPSPIGVHGSWTAPRHLPIDKRTSMSAADDILAWSTSKLTPWRQDALRRLACASALSATDHDELLGLIKHAAGFVSDTPPGVAVPLEASHMHAAATGAPLTLKSVRSVTNVNRLAPSAELLFRPDGLTVIYGRNGSGKSGFVRILRTACRTRSDVAKLKVLADVYGPPAGAQSAEIVIDCGAGEETVPWSPGAPVSDRLLRAAVFDTNAAEIYVDSGNHIQFLPFGLALPHRLNEACLTLQVRLENERAIVTDKIRLARPQFAQPRSTKAQDFCSSISGDTSAETIAAACQFTEIDDARLTEVARILTATASAQADVAALIEWTNGLTADCTRLSAALCDAALDYARTLGARAVEARRAASLGAADLFADQPLEGVGEDTWRRLWAAAREYSVNVAYRDRAFPVISTDDGEAACVLCHQPLGPDAAKRLQTFEDFVSGALRKAADKAEEDVAMAAAEAPAIDRFIATDWPTRREQIASRDADLAVQLDALATSFTARRAALLAVLIDPTAPAPAPITAAPDERLAALLAALETELGELEKAADDDKRTLLIAERNELEDRKTLSPAREALVELRDLMAEDKRYSTALAATLTKTITQKANELVDLHLTTAVLDRFAEERKALDIEHLRIGLARTSGKTKASFSMSPGTTLTKFSSEILSEGEQRALALATFFTEVALTDGSGPIVIDDPVSSLDRDRGLLVAKRIAAEAERRQVIVFTHDLVFFNDLCGSADALGVGTSRVGLFADASNAGRVDPAGVTWTGLPVKEMIKKIKGDAVPVRSLHASSPADYEFGVKNLYGRLRDAYERTVEEHVFFGVIRRGVDRIETLKLRYVHLTDELAIRFHAGMTKANTFSHANPLALTVQAPTPAEFDNDVAFLEQLIMDLKAAGEAAQANRPSMKP